MGGGLECRAGREPDLDDHDRDVVLRLWAADYLPAPTSMVVARIMRLASPFVGMEEIWETSAYFDV